MKDTRYEVKYVLNLLEYNSIIPLLNRIDLHKTFPKRKVNSLYFDTPFFDFCKDNITGLSDRTKVRLRWYNSFIEPTLEFKLRKDRVGTKRRFKINHVTELDFNNLKLRDLNKKIFKDLDSTSIIKSPLTPVVYINYDREYFEVDKRLRITIDKNIKIKPVSLNQRLDFYNEIRNRKIIIEIKFPQNSKSFAEKLIKDFELNPIRNSKYLNGISRLGYATYI